MSNQLSVRQSKPRLNYVVDGHPRTQYRGFIYIYTCWMNIIFQVMYLAALVAYGIVPNNMFTAASTCYCVVVAIHSSLCVEYHTLDIKAKNYDSSILNYELCIQKYDYIFAYAINVTSCILFDTMFLTKETDIHGLHAMLWTTSIFKVALFIVFAVSLKIPASYQWNEFIAVGIILSIIDAITIVTLIIYYYYGYIKHGYILLAFGVAETLAIVGASTHVIGRLLNLNKSPRFNTHDIMHVGIVAAIVVSYIVISLFVFDKI